tara:strand:- start:1682 stop:2050 length:369 start_codon:yes stop_codon:yes gene_type:complete
MKLKILSFIFSLNFTLCLSADKIFDESQIHKNLRCLVCQGQSIADSNSEFALNLKAVVKDLIDQGKTEDEIYIFLSEKYGDWILYKPKFNLETFLLWSFPYMALVLGGLIIVFIVRKRVKKA